MVKFVYFFNWVCAGALAVLILLLVMEGKKVGDAATRGLGSSLLGICVAGLVVLVVLNLLPWAWSKYAGFGLVMVPLGFVALMLAWPRWTAHQREARARAEAAKPIFADADRERLARLVEDGEPGELRARLSSTAREAVVSEELLWFAIQEASASRYRTAEKLECVRALVEAGAPLDRVVKASTPVQATAANTGNAAMLRYLFEHGADANGRDPHFDRPYLFDAAESSMDPVGSVRVFAEFGADMNATAVFDEEDGPVTPVIRAARFGRWGVCAALLEKGARGDFRTRKGKSLAFYLDEAAEGIEKYGSAEVKGEFGRLREMVKGRR